jgi:NAD/NADP transhydrogenase alpha subunit
VRSLGAKFVETGVTRKGTGGYARELDGGGEKRSSRKCWTPHSPPPTASITTAGVPGRPAPRIITRAAVERMKPGAVIVDLLAEGGGNCELTRAGETVDHNGVRILGPVNLPATVAYHASEMYAKNLLNFIKPALKDGRSRSTGTTKCSRPPASRTTADPPRTDPQARGAPLNGRRDRHVTSSCWPRSPATRVIATVP